MAKSNGIKSLKQAAKLLNKHSPDGESLAYINPEEAKLLRSHGGSGIQTLSGVPSYWSFPDWVPFVGGDDLGDVVGNIFSRYKNKPAVYSKEDPTKIVERAQSGMGNLFQDAISVYAALRAKKEKEGLNAQEMSEFNRLNAQLTGAKTEFDVGTDFGTQLKPEYKTDITKSAAYTPIDFSGETTPELITTPIATPAEGGRIGAFNGGIQGLMPQQGMPQQAMLQQGMPQPGLMPQQAMPQQGMPRMGYNRGLVVNPGGYKGTTWNEFKQDTSIGLPSC